MRTAVCIPVRDDAAGLARTLAAIERAGDAPYVVVAVDGPQPHVESVARSGADRIVVLPDPRGSYAARNAAVDALPVDVDVVAFTDAGCVPLPGWLDAHRTALMTSSLSGGAVHRVRSPRVTPAEYVDSVRNLVQQAYVLQDGFAATCNLAVRREVLNGIRFDERLRSGGDRDFCHRAAAAGHPLVYTADAAVEHDCRRTLRAVTAKARRVGTGVAALPVESRPSRLPRPALRLGLARRAYREGVSRSPWWLARVAATDALRTLAFVRSARRAGFAPGAPDGDVDVIVLLGTRWAALEHHTTRWRHVIDAWASDPAVGSVVVVDFPRFRLGALLSGDRRLASPSPSWRPDVGVIDATVPAGPRRGPLDRLAWWRVARAIRRALPSTPRPRLVACATPLWAPVMHRLGASWTLFDAVDDQRGLASHGARMDRVTEGYAAVASRPPTAVTAVSDVLAEKLQHDLGRAVTAVHNGVALHRFQHPGAAPDGLPDGPFAVYAGVLEARVDIDLLEALADAVGVGGVVVCGPATPAVAARLTASAVTWLGPVDPALIPGVLGRATVGLLPHHVTDLTRSMDPLKLLEYLAAGLTVVATPVPVPADLAAAAPWIVAAPDAAAFVRTVQAMLADPPSRHDGTCVAHRRWPDVATRLLAAATHRAATSPVPQEVAA